MYDYIEVPPIFYELKKLPPFKHAVVAGGYLRDQSLGIKPNDLDIFFPITSESSWQENFNKCWPEMEKLGVNFVNHVNIPKGLVVNDKGYAKKPDLKAQYNLSWHGIDIDLMAMRMNIDWFTSNLLEGFPFTLQQIAFDGKKVITSKDFDHDLVDKIMRLRFLNSVYDLPRIMDKFNSLKARYPKMYFETDYILAKRDGDDWL